MSPITGIHPLLADLKAIIPSLGKALGDDAEVVLHDLSHLEDSVIAIEGNVTGRKVGAPLTDLVLRLLRQGDPTEDLINYASRTADGRMLKSSTMFIRDEKGALIGCLCINFDITKWMEAQHVLENLCRTEPLGGPAPETFAPDVEEMLGLMIEEVVRQKGVPVAAMRKEHRLDVVKSFDEQGGFLIKGAVARLARVLRVSRYTIYNYLDEIRSERS